MSLSINTFLLLGTVAVLSITSCKKKKDKVPVELGNYIGGLRTEGTDGTSDYLLQKQSLMEGTFSATGNGIEQNGWNYFTQAGNTVLALGYGNNTATGYILSDGKLTKKGSFIFQRIDYVKPVDDNTLVGIGAPWGGGSYNNEIQIIDANAVAFSKRKTTTVYRMSKSDTLNYWPTGAVVRDDKVFVAFYPVGGKSWLTPSTDTAYYTIYSYPGLDSLKTIKTTLAGPIGYYGSQPCTFKDESGNIYSISTASYAAGFTKRSKPSGILRVKAGEEQFDSYFLNISDNYDGRLLSGAYVGNGKVVASFVSNTNDNASLLGDGSSAWGAFGNQQIIETVIIDLNAKTMTKVIGVPVHHGQYMTPYYIENGKVYISVRTSTGTAETRIYEIDPLTATGKKGALVEGMELQGIFKIN